MRNLFKKTSKTIKKVIHYSKPSDFKKGEIYRMSPGYYTKHPYYIIISGVGIKFIETNIPGHHSLLIEYPSLTWDYQTARMTYIGFGKNHTKLIHNQKLN